MKTIAITSFALLALAVILGAFGAHGLKEQISPESLANWKTANFYHFIHALGMLLLVVLYHNSPNHLLRKAAWLLCLGIVLFSGSIYWLSIKSVIGVIPLSILGPITPLGGLVFICGWIIAALGVYRS